MQQTITRLSALRTGDRILSIGRISHARKPLVVRSPLGPVPNAGPVQGVDAGPLAGGVQFYLYPSQCDGQTITIERG